jgi:hypothetical protein
MIVQVGLFGMAPIFLLHVVIMAVRERQMVVGVRVPVRSVIPFAQDAIFVMMRHMVVIVHVDDFRVRMLRLVPMALNVLLDS